MKALRSLLFLAAVGALASIHPVTIADINGDGAVHAFVATSTQARWVQIQAPAANASPVVVGDASISTSRGISLAPGGSIFLPPGASDPRIDPTDVQYDLAAWFYLVQSGDKIKINYAR
jgi:hypothetical protein